MKSPLQCPVAAAAVVLVLSACGGSPPSAARASSPSSRLDEVLAEVGNVQITRREVEDRAGGALMSLRQQEYEIHRQAVDQLVGEKLLEAEAERRGVSREELLTREVDGRVPAPSRQEIDRVYRQVAPRLGGQSRDQAAPEIARMLRQQAVAERRAAFERELRRERDVKVLLQAPRVEVAVAAGAPSIGPQDAPITIVEYLDYQCPYCKRAQGTVDQLLQKYQGKIRFVHRDYPIEGHPGALPASRAARCAGEQERFWEYHQALFAVAGDFDDEGLKTRARAIGVDVGAFSKCLASDRHDADIRASMAAGSRLGVSSTPTFFINGRMVLGARPLEDFVEVIDEELAAASAGR